MQLTHHLAVKSTNTVRPSRCNCCSRASLYGSQAITTGPAEVTQKARKHAAAAAAIPPVQAANRLGSVSQFGVRPMIQQPNQTPINEPNTSTMSCSGKKEKMKATVASSKKPSSCLNVSIQAPGLGRNT